MLQDSSKSYFPMDKKSPLFKPAMPSQLSQLPLYPETRRLLKNSITRYLIIAAICLVVFYKFSLESCIPVPSSPPRSYSTIPSDPRPVIQGVPIGSGNEDVADPLQPRSAVGKVHAVFGEPNPVYERALKLHESHAERQGHPMFVLRERLLSGLWSKPAFILSVMLQELAKPEGERLEWLLWIDADIVVMNPQIQLDIFIPPTPEFSYVNMLVTNDRHGLNNGCFLIRINPWAVKLLSGVIAFHSFKPEVELKYSEQSALEEMIEDTYWRRSVVHVPQYWFNAYPSALNQDRAPRPHEFRPGGLQIHFAGNKDGKRPERMDTWMSIAEQEIAPYDIEVEKMGLQEDITAFWQHLSEERTKKGIKPIGS